MLEDGSPNLLNPDNIKGKTVGGERGDQAGVLAYSNCS